MEFPVNHFSPVPSPVDVWPVFNDDWWSTSRHLAQNSSSSCPVIVGELAALDVDVISVSFDVPSFPRSDVSLPVDGQVVIVSSDVFLLGQWLERPGSIDLLLSDEKLLVWGSVWSCCDKGASGWVCSQIRWACGSEGEIFETFASAAEISQVSLRIKNGCGQCVSVNSNFSFVSVFVHCVWDSLNSLPLINSGSEARFGILRINDSTSGSWCLCIFFQRNDQIIDSALCETT